MRIPTTFWATRLGKALGVIARKPRRGLAEVANEAGASLLSGSSLKAALDLDWDNPTERAEALSMVLGVLTAVETWLGTHPEGSETPAVQQSVATAERMKQQDVQVTETGTAELRKAVAKDRRMSVEDAQMRHGRQRRSVRVDGYKRHVLHDLDTGFELDWERLLIRCPNHVELPFEPGGVVHFPAETCAACPLHQQCAGTQRQHSPR